MADKSERRRGVVQLNRLVTLTDVVYALVLWRIFQIIPRPDHTDWTPGYFLSFFADNALTYVLALIGVAVTIIYWIQNNKLFGDLARTDGRHTTVSIIQLFCLLLFLKALRIGVEMTPSAGTRTLESAAAESQRSAGGIRISFTALQQFSQHALYLRSIIILRIQGHQVFFGLLAQMAVHM